MKRNSKAKRSSPRQKNIFPAPRTLEEFAALPEKNQDAWNRTVNAISKMKSDGISLSRASKEFGLDPRDVLRLASSALERKSKGQYAAKARDTLLRILVVPTESGLREVALRDSREASRLGTYWDGVQKYLETGETSGLESFRAKSILLADGTRFPLLTDLDSLDRLGSAGVLSFESLYAKVG